MSIWENIECELCANHCDVLNFGSAEQTGSYIFKVRFNDNERVVKIDFQQNDELLFDVQNLNEEGISYIAIYRPDNALIGVCKVKVSIDYTPHGDINCDIPPFIPDCPSLCEVILDKEWVEIKDCMSEEQISEAEDDLCEICPECLPVSYEILRDGEPYQSGNVPSGGNLTVDVPSDIPPCADATLTLNGGAFLNVPSGVTQDIELVSQSDTPIVPTSVVGSKITITNTTVIRAEFAEDTLAMPLLTITSDNEGIYTSMSQDGASGSISYEKNGSPASLPITLVATDTLLIERTVDSADGWVRLSGTHG